MSKVSKPTNVTAAAAVTAKTAATKTGPASVKAAAPVAAKTAPVTAKTAPPSSPHLTEDEKRADPENFIENPHTKKMVKRSTAQGKKLVEAEKTGKPVERTMTETERLMLVVQTIRDVTDLDDSAIKTALSSIKDQLPRSFPVYWGGKHKEARSADHPKGPKNAYIYFCMAVRPSQKKANPEMNTKEMISLLAKLWNETPEEDREEYEILAANDKVRYQTQMEEFERTHPDEARSSTRSSSPGKPTKVTAYGVFCNEHRQMVIDSDEKLTGREVSKILAEKWKILKNDHPDEAKKFQDEANEANKGFAERVLEYHSTPTSSPKKLSEAEQRKADDPDNYELNPDTGRYREKKKPKEVKEPKEKKPRAAKVEAKEKISKIAEEEAAAEEALLIE